MKLIHEEKVNENITIKKYEGKKPKAGEVHKYIENANTAYEFNRELPERNQHEN